MDYLQYKGTKQSDKLYNLVLNLVINGLPSILSNRESKEVWLF